jgi:hypothetical protein
MALNDVLAAYDRLERTKTEWDKNRFQRAVRRNIESIFKDPDNPSRHAKLSLIKMQLGAFDNDIEGLKKFLVEAGALRKIVDQDGADEIWFMPQNGRFQGPFFPDNMRYAKILTFAVLAIAFLILGAEYIPQSTRCKFIDWGIVERTLGDFGKCEKP